MFHSFNLRLCIDSFREKTNHERRLQHLEEEMEGQVLKVEQQVSEKQRHKFERETAALRSKFQHEVSQLKENLDKLQAVSGVTDPYNIGNIYSDENPRAILWSAIADAVDSRRTQRNGIRVAPSG